MIGMFTELRHRVPRKGIRKGFNHRDAEDTESSLCSL